MPRRLLISKPSSGAHGRDHPRRGSDPAASVHCTYAVDWTATKLRWDLAADDKELAVLNKLVEDCPDATVSFKPAA
jgi:hypothetical protein